LLLLAPFCGLLGFLTPMLVDHRSGGDPRRAGVAYAVNVIGCLLGPLLAGFVLLPAFGERWSLTLLTLPMLLAGLAAAGASRARRAAAVVACASAAVLVAATHDFETAFPQRVVRRDSTATVIAIGSGPYRQLLVNGVGMTSLTPITKMMAHLPLAQLDTSPQSGLTVCFGMGTSFRSMHAWGIRTTVVDLVPSVPEMFGYFHADAPELLRSPRARVVIDDGRRFLDRGGEIFDAIVIDPPPPIEAVGSSLLYSRQFYQSARARLRPGGILQQWIPTAEPPVALALVGALASEFTHVRAFRSVAGWGVHLLASDRPMPRRSARELLARMPEKAAHDLVEWGPFSDPKAMLDTVLGRELDLSGLQAHPGPALDDDRPINEYFWYRRFLARRR
jgi:spermidine synthase